MKSRLQEEIKQTKPFPSPAAEAVLGLLRTAAILDHALAEVLKPFGLTSSQYNVLRILRGAGTDGLCGREVGERLIAKVPDVSRLLDRMTDVGLVARVRDRADRRHVTSRITRKGLGLLEKSTGPLEAAQARWTTGVGEARLKKLIAILDDLRHPV